MTVKLRVRIVENDGQAQLAKVNDAVLKQFEKELTVASDPKSDPKNGVYSANFLQMTPQDVADLVAEFLSKSGVSELSNSEIQANADVAHKLVLNKFKDQNVEKYSGGVPTFITTMAGIVSAAVAGRFTRDPRYMDVAKQLGFDLEKLKQQAGVK